MNTIRQNIYKKSNLLKPVVTATLVIALGAFGLLSTISQALPALQVIQTVEIEAINLDSKPELKATIENLNKVDPQKPAITRLQRRSKGEIVTTGEIITKRGERKTQEKNNSLKVSIKSDRSIVMDNNRNKINLRLDNHGENNNQRTEVKLVDNKVIYQGQKVDTIVEAIDGGIRQTINIKDSTAPKVYNFPMDLQNGQRIVVNKDGSANVMNSKNESITMILKPWARDSNNKEIPTHYTVDNNILKQHIITNSMTKYPVKADPTWCGDVVSSVRWVWRNIYNATWNWSLRLLPTWCGVTATGPTPWASWQEVSDKTPSCARFSGRICVARPWDKRWNTNQYWSMYNQYVCHTDWMIGYKLARGLNPYKNPVYHLDPWRPDRGYWGFVNAKCNDNKIVNY